MNRTPSPKLPDPRVPLADAELNAELDTELDTALDSALGADQDAILPSCGFAGAVMTAVRNEAAAHPPIPFPWRRALPGLALAALLLPGLIIAAVLAVRAIPAAAPQAVPHAPGFWQAGLAALAPARLTPLLHSAAAPDVLWPLFALLLAAACLQLSHRLLSSR